MTRWHAHTYVLYAKVFLLYIDFYKIIRATTLFIYMLDERPRDALRDSIILRFFLFYMRSSDRNHSDVSVCCVYMQINRRDSHHPLTPQTHPFHW